MLFGVHFSFTIRPFGVRSSTIVGHKVPKSSDANYNRGSFSTIGSSKYGSFRLAETVAWGGNVGDGAARSVGDKAYDLVSAMAESMVNPIGRMNETQRNLPIATALQRIQTNMDILDNVAGRTPQLTRVELFILMSSVAVSAGAPFVFGSSVVEVLVPSMAAVSASVGLSAEYVGKVCVSKAKEISALAIQAAAEAEVLLANAERSKAILPLCVGISTTASAFALLLPSLLNSVSAAFSVQLVTEIYLLCPLIAVLSAAVAGLATQESREIANRAAGLGNRRFASSGDVGRTWMSATEQVEMAAKRSQQKWQTFALSVLPAPIIAAFTPADLGLKAVVCAAIAAVQAAFYLAICEYYIATAVEAVALKARSSAVADTYANQSQRAGSILPFTSALAGLCAAASAAAVEILPLVAAPEIQALITVSFPFGASLFAAAASVAKARCEVILLYEDVDFCFCRTHNVNISFFFYFRSTQQQRTCARLKVSRLPVTKRRTQYSPCGSK